MYSIPLTKCLLGPESFKVRSISRYWTPSTEQMIPTEMTNANTHF